MSSNKHNETEVDGVTKICALEFAGTAAVSWFGFTNRVSPREAGGAEKARVVACCP